MSRESAPRVYAVILRHGAYHQPPDTPSAHLPHPLTDDGVAQARAAADELRALAGRLGFWLDGTVHTSRMLRSWETGTLIAERLTRALGRAFGVTEHAALDERSLGCAANLTVAQIEEVLARDPRAATPAPGWKSTAHYRLPLAGAESLWEAGERVARFLEDTLDALAARVSRDTARVFVGHGGAFRHAAVHLGLLDLSEVRGLSMHHARPIVLTGGADGRLDRIAGEWKIRARPTEVTR